LLSKQALRQYNRGMLTFYAGSGSPFAWRVWLTLEHKQLPYELHMLSFSAGDLRKPEYLAINPRGKVPAIVDDGMSLWESAAIVEYLEERYPERPVLPRDPAERARVRRIIREADEYLGRGQEDLVEQIFFQPDRSKRDAQAIAAAREICTIELSRLENELRGPFLVGDHPTAADYTVYPIVALLGRLELKHDKMFELGPKTQAWKKRIEALPFYDKTYPPHWRQS
jgi:glutathione S-transferase